MTPDVDGLIRFYKSPLGRLVRTLLRRQLLALAGDTRGLRVLGLGFATPYMRAMLKPSERVLAFMPARQGASAWPREGPSRTVLCDPLEMPLNDASVDLVVIVHALEHAVDDEELMRELWRICAPGAHVVIAVPRRRGLWSGLDNNPFGFGHPYSKSQLNALLREHSFTPLAWRDCVYVPPVNASPVLRSSKFIERGARLFGATFAGLLCVRAKKEMLPAVARRRSEKKAEMQPGLAPQAARESL